jgi:glutamine cyclotransferase
MSDGSDSLRVVSPTAFQVQRVVHVHYKGAPLYKLNELEYVDGELLANVYESNWILRIDPPTSTAASSAGDAEMGELAFDDARGVSGTWVKESDPYTQIWSLDVD